MKTRTLIIYILGASVVSSMSPAQDMEAPKPYPLEPVFREPDLPETQPQSPFAAAAAEAPPEARAVESAPRVSAPRQRYPGPVPPTRAPEGPKELRIFELQHAQAATLANMLSRIFRVETHVDQRLNRLIVNATKEQMQGVESLIEAMDIAGSDASTHQDTQDLVYRVYMFEIPSEDEGMRSFLLRLYTPFTDPMQPNTTSEGVPARELLDVAADKDLRIVEFLQTGGESPDSEIETLIQGKAASDQSLRRLIEKFPESRILELRWDDDETFTGGIAAAHYSVLPEQLQKHIHKFLGPAVQTVGYWFGNLSAPGGVTVPIGPWTLKLMLETESNGMLDVRVDVEVPSGARTRGGRPGRMGNDEILSNSLRAKIGKPIIIGYNRQSYGTRKMGAMVIVPEQDSFESEAIDAKKM